VVIQTRIIRLATIFFSKIEGETITNTTNSNSANPFQILSDAFSSCGGSLADVVLVLEDPPELCAPPHHTSEIIDNNIIPMTSPKQQHHDLPGSPPVTTTATNSGGGGMGQLLGGWAAATSQTVQQWTVKKYTLPDKTVASQVLMYRQLLHTSCRPGLKLTRPYQATVAQQSVKHMPWWQTELLADGTVVGMEQTGKMCMSYDNLIKRLWYKGALHETATHEADPPPIPHEYWVSRLGFQQPDPVTDFRSGGILSLAMMVWVVESCPDVYRRFCRSIPTAKTDDGSGDDGTNEAMSEAGDASVLPFGITSINVTGMMAKFLMLSKSTDRMDALLSQKPFWSMFSDPNALLACQELALDMLADVVQELLAVRQLNDGENAAVTVFDFSHILSVTEKRVEFDLLGAGPVSVKELRMVHRKLQQKYKQQLEKQLQRIQQQQADDKAGITPEMKRQQQQEKLKGQLSKQASGLGAAASGLFSKIKLQRQSSANNSSTFTDSADGVTATQPTIATIPPAFAVPTTATETITFDDAPPATTAAPPDLLSGTSCEEEEDGWANVQSATEQVGNFSIIDDDDDEDLL